MASSTESSTLDLVGTVNPSRGLEKGRLPWARRPGEGLQRLGIASTMTHCARAGVEELLPILAHCTGLSGRCPGFPASQLLSGKVCPH